MPSIDSTLAWTLGLTAFAFAGSGVLAVLLGYRKWSRGLMFAVLTAAAFALTIAAHLGIAPASHDPNASTLVYLGTHQPEILREVGRLYAADPLIVVGLPAGADMVRVGLPNATFEPLDDPAVSLHGTIVEAQVRDLTRRLETLTPTGKVVFIAPRYLDDLSAMRHALDVLSLKYPDLKDRIDWVRLEDLGLTTPQVRVVAPILVTPDQPELPVTFGIYNLPPDVTVQVNMIGPKAGSEDGPVAVTPLGLVSPGQIGVGGSPIVLDGSQFSANGVKLPIAKEGRSITVECSLMNAMGEVVGFARSSTTTSIHPVGILDPSGGQSPSGLGTLVSGLGLPYEFVNLNMSDAADPEENSRRLVRWGVLFVDRRLSAAQGEMLRKTLAACVQPPTLIFVGVGEIEPNDAGTGAPAGWAALAPRLATLANPPRKILFGRDSSGSMYSKTPDGTMTKLQFADHLFDKLRGNLDQRSSVISRSSEDGLELADFLVNSDRASQKDSTISDLVYIFDPDDVRNDSHLDDDARKAAEALIKRGVKIWLISAGRDVKGTDGRGKDDLGDAAYDSVIASLGPQSNTQAFVANLQKTLFLEMFPRFPIRAGDGMKLLPDPSKARQLQEFIDRDAARIGAKGLPEPLLRVGVPFSAFAEAGKHADNDRAVLWAMRDATGQSTPVLLKDEADLGGGRRSTVYQLCLDIQSEAGRVVTEAASKDDHSPIRDALSGLLVRVIAACAIEPYRPTIYWASRQGGGLIFFPSDYRPFQIEPEPKADPAGLRGIGIGARIVSGPGIGLVPRLEIDDRRLDQIMVRVADLKADPTANTSAVAVTYVVEDHRPEIGRVEVTIAQTPNPPRFLRAAEIPASARKSAESREDFDPTLNQTGQVTWSPVLAASSLRYVILAMFVVIAIYLARGL